MRNLVGRHRRITDEHDLIVLRIFVEDFPGRQTFGHAPTIVFPHRLVDEVVKIETFHVFELGASRREQFLAYLHMGVHRSTNIEKQQYLDRVLSFGTHLDVQHSPVVSRRLDRIFHIKLFFFARTRKLA